MCGIALVLDASLLDSDASDHTTTSTPPATCSRIGSTEHPRCNHTERSACAAPACARFGAAFTHELVQKLSQRGPDHIATHRVAFATSSSADIATDIATPSSSSIELDLHAAVLHLRGDVIHPQPVIDTHNNVLCWNGEVFGTADGNAALDEHASDTAFVSKALSAATATTIDRSTQHERILQTLQSLHGPFAFVFIHHATQRVYFGHDRFGRRSLLVHCADRSGTAQHALFDTLATQALASPSGSARVVLDRHDLTRLCVSSVAVTAAVDANGDRVAFDEVPATGVFVLDAQRAPPALVLEFHAYAPLHVRHASAPADVYVSRLPLVLSSTSTLESAANALLIALSNAVGVRIRTIPSPPLPLQPPPTGSIPTLPPARVGILFSGGLDSVVLAALAHFHTIETEPIELLNVCFDAATSYRSPDRLAAMRSFGELKALYPMRDWRFVHLDVPFANVQRHQRTVSHLMAPCATHMDFNIGAAFWFLSRGEGKLALSGAITDSVDSDLNAFLQRGKDARTIALEAALDALALFSTSVDSVDSVEDNDSSVCPAAGCRRKHKPGCAFRLCRLCCLKVQKLLLKLERGAATIHSDERRKCELALCALGIGSDSSEVLTQLLAVVHAHCSGRGTTQAAAALCSVHHARVQQQQQQHRQRSHDGDRTESLATETTSAPAAPSQSMSVPQSPVYIATARVLLVGIGADEQLGGYGRHKTAFDTGGNDALQAELTRDMTRIWKRNLGRDDRCIASHGREARFPFLDERVVAYIQSLPLSSVCDFTQQRGVGDKLVLRVAAKQLGLQHCTGLAKRAIQFGTRLAKHSNVLAFGSNRQASGSAVFHVDDRPDAE